MDDLSRWLMPHTDRISVSVLQNMQAKRVIIPSRDLFLAFKSVYTSESLADKLMKLLSQNVEPSDVLALQAHLLKSTGRGEKLIKPTILLLTATMKSKNELSAHLKHNIKSVVACLIDVLENQVKMLSDI